MADQLKEMFNQKYFEKLSDEFSKAYKVLYKQDSLCYLTEILDSAQESLFILNFIIL